MRRPIALLALLVLLTASSAFALDTGTPYEPPDARIKPPVGVIAEPESSFFEAFLEWIALAARIHPPGG
jgi:hypothetical protein